VIGCHGSLMDIRALGETPPLGTLNRHRPVFSDEQLRVVTREVKHVTFTT
jgi:hypothetical protein